MAYTFLKVQGHKIGKSLLEADYLEVADNIPGKREARVRVILPLGSCVALAFNEQACLWPSIGRQSPDD
jgi:phosphoglycerate kinase